MDEESSMYMSAEESGDSKRQSMVMGSNCLEFEFPMRRHLLCDEPSNKNIFFV